jgi:hypothetical protein
MDLYMNIMTYQPYALHTEPFTSTNANMIVQTSEVRKFTLFSCNVL